MKYLTGLFKKVADFLDFFGPLLEFARNFTGFTAFTAFLIIAGLFLVPLMFSQGIFDEFILKFDTLTPDQTFQFLLILTVAIFGVIFTVIGLALQDARFSADRRNVLQVIVHEEGDRTRPIAGAEVMLLLDEVKTDSTNDGGRASFQIGPEWLNKQSSINASHDDYEERSPQVELLRPSNHILLALKRKTITHSHLPDKRLFPGGGEVSTDVNPLFLSYSRQHWDDFVSPLADQLREDGHSVWVDQHLLMGGDNWMDSIGEALDTCNLLILVISPESLESKYVKMEYRHFFNHNKPIIPLLYLPVDRIPPELATTQYIDFRDGITEKAFSQLAEVIDARLSDLK